VLVECGFSRVTTSDGVEYTFTPSFARIAELGSPTAIVELYAGLHGPRAAQDAAYVLGMLCDQDNPLDLIGWYELEPEGDLHAAWVPGLMPASEQIILARHLMQHGIAGKAKPGAKDSGKFSARFDAAEYIAAATVHLGLSDADASGLSMTDFQIRFELKFPDLKAKESDVPTREEYEAAMARLGAKRGA
jgi:hypothetical protein